MNIKYFAYGSNMDRKRVIERGCKFENVSSAILREHELVFDKKSAKVPGATFANVKKKAGSIVEGMLYTMDESMMAFLDKFEGYPKHYTRNELTVENEDDKITAWVYVAQKE